VSYLDPGPLARSHAAVQHVVHGACPVDFDPLGARRRAKPPAPAGDYVLVAARWDQVVSGPGEPRQVKRHHRGDVVHLDTDDATRLLHGGAVRPAPIDGEG